MEEKNEYPKNEQPGKQEIPSSPDEQEEVEFENPSVDPGFDTSYVSPEEDEPAEADESPESKKPVADNEKGNDALNYNNDRENGAYNPKNI